MTDTEILIALAELSARYQAIANRATTDAGRSRALQIRTAAHDIQHVLDTGRLPAYLTTD